MRHIYTSIDIGTNTIKAVVCELFHNKLNLLAASSVKSSGIKKGLITDVTSVTKAVETVIKDIETMLGIKIKKVITTIPEYYAEYKLIKGSVSITTEDSIVNGDQILKVYRNAMQKESDSNSEMVTILPIDFKVDEKVLKDPKGIKGSTLEVRAIMATTPKKNIYSVISLLESIGLEVVDISLGSISDMYANRNSKYDNSIGAIINIGSETTKVSIHNRGIVVKSSIIGLGGKTIDNDISYMYKIDMDTANKVKEKFALAHRKYASSNDYYEIKTENGGNLKINQFELSEVVMSRVEEILTLAMKEINVLTNKEIEYIIVTGGTSNLVHLEYMVEEILGKKAHIGTIGLIGLRNNKYSTCIGNVIYYINKIQLLGRETTFVDDEDNELFSTKKSLINISNDTMLGKVFGYFFGE